MPNDQIGYFKNTPIFHSQENDAVFSIKYSDPPIPQAGSCVIMALAMYTERQIKWKN